MGSVLCVDALDVALQMVGAAEPLVANFTLVGFNSSVDRTSVASGGCFLQKLLRMLDR